MDPISSADLRLPGWLLLVGGALGIIGAFCPPYRQWSGTQEEGFRAIAGNPLGWWCIHIGFFSGAVLSALGLAALASVLHRRSGGDWALIAAGLYGIAGVAWITNIAYRLSIWNWAAQAFVATGTTPELFLPLRRFAGVLFGIFSVVGYASVACLGAAVLCAQLASAWLGWAIVACGISAGYIVGYNVPLIMYVPFVALGIALLG